MSRPEVNTPPATPAVTPDLFVKTKYGTKLKLVSLVENFPSMIHVHLVTDDRSMTIELFSLDAGAETQEALRRLSDRERALVGAGDTTQQQKAQAIAEAGEVLDPAIRATKPTVRVEPNALVASAP